MVRTAASAKSKGAKASKGELVRHRKVLRDNIGGLSKPAFMRLLKRGGVKRVSGLVYEEMRQISKMFLEDLLRDVVTFTEHARHKTVLPEDLYAALGLKHHCLLAGINSTLKKTKSLQGCRGKGPKKVARKADAMRRKSHPGTVSLRTIKKEQRKSCLIFPKIVFHRLVVEICQDFRDNFRFNQFVFPLAQLALENYLVKLAQHANLLAIHARRSTLQPSDLNLSLKIQDY